jgi:hypothetical protein
VAGLISAVNFMKTPTNAEAVLGYLKGRNWTSPTELGRVIWGKGRHSSSASPTCLKLVKAGKLERNQRGHYRPSDYCEKNERDFMGKPL